ncbi:MAG: transporter, partial [Acidobacteriota bacterium]
AAALAHDGNAATSASGQKGLFNLIYGENLCSDQWAFSTYYNKFDRRVQSDPVTLAFDPLWTDWDMDVERLTVAIGYGITDKIELSVMAPYLSFDADGRDGEFRQSGILNGQLFSDGILDQSGFGNVRVAAKFQVARTETYAIGLMPFIDLPTGDDDEAVVTGDTGLGLTFAFNNTAGWVLNASYFDPGDSDFLDVSDEIHLGIGYGRDINERTEWITELSGILYTDSNGEHDAADIVSGARWRLNNPDWAFNAGLRVDLSDPEFDYTPIGGLVGVSYSPKNRYTLSVTREGTGTGSVSGEQIDCGSTCEATYRCGETVTLTATPDPKSRFDGWGGDCGGSEDSITVTLDGDKSCSARFVKLYDMTVESQRTRHPDGDEPGDGTVEFAGQTCKDKCTVTRDVGTQIDLKALAAAESTFEGWSVDCSGKGETTSLTLDSDKECVATFQGPPRPCQEEPIVGEFAKCGRYDVSYSCDSATWSQLVEGFTGTDVPAGLEASDANERKTPLCDVVNFLRACPQVTACVAGRETASENHCTAEERAAKVAGFLIGQAKYPFFAGVTADRIKLSPACEAEDGTGRSVEIFLE